LGYDFKRQRIVKKFVAEKVVRPWPDRRLRLWDHGVTVGGSRRACGGHEGPRRDVTAAGRRNEGARSRTSATSAARSTCSTCSTVTAPADAPAASHGQVFRLETKSWSQYSSRPGEFVLVFCVSVSRRNVSARSQRQNCGLHFDLEANIWVSAGLEAKMFGLCFRLGFRGVVSVSISVSKLWYWSRCWSGRCGLVCHHCLLFADAPATCGFYSGLLAGGRIAAAPSTPATCGCWMKRSRRRRRAMTTSTSTSRSTTSVSQVLAGHVTLSRLLRSLSPL